MMLGRYYVKLRLILLLKKVNMILLALVNLKI